MKDVIHQELRSAFSVRTGCRIAIPYGGCYFYGWSGKPLLERQHRYRKIRRRRASTHGRLMRRMRRMCLCRRRRVLIVLMISVLLVIRMVRTRFSRFFRSIPGIDRAPAVLAVIALGAVRARCRTIGRREQQHWHSRQLKQQQPCTTACDDVADHESKWRRK